MDGFNIHLSKGHMLYELAQAIFREGLGNLGPRREISTERKSL